MHDEWRKIIGNLVNKMQISCEKAQKVAKKGNSEKAKKTDEN